MSSDSSMDHVLEKCDITLYLYHLLLQPVITLDGSISHTFPNDGMHTITVQVAAANTILQDTKTIAVKGQYFLNVSHGTSLYFLDSS